ncbi:MAG: ATP-binding cassette domain-containing protein [Deltaproteobacteria bacterium]|jgi:oligopeptide/dipeptide ABC transporter ATP-binding protein|nr:ATP-binding cassette domain-containing protein [Deltaproteobacteria bacterium]
MTAPDSAPQAPPLFELKNLSRFFYRQAGFLGSSKKICAVNQVNLQLARGETLGLVGESGSGKSTLARMAVRLLKPSAGDVLLDGKSVFSADRRFRATLPGRIQMVFQDPYSSLNPRLRVGSSIGEALACAGMPKSGRREKIVRLLEQVGLDEDCVNRFPHEFSGGQRQRMSLARALAPDPDIIVCDEPVSSLDASVQAQVLNLLKDNQDRLNLSYLFISHDLAVVNHMSDKIAVMYAGSIVEAGPAAEIFRNPRHPYARELLSASCGEAGAGRKQDPGRPPGEVSAISRSCAFLRRCPDIGPLCANNFPELKPVADKNFDPGHLVRCWNTR